VINFWLYLKEHFRIWILCWVFLCCSFLLSSKYIDWHWLLIDTDFDVLKYLHQCIINVQLKTAPKPILWFPACNSLFTAIIWIDYNNARPILFGTYNYEFENSSHAKPKECNLFWTFTYCFLLKQVFDKLSQDLYQVWLKSWSEVKLLLIKSCAMIIILTNDFFLSFFAAINGATRQCSSCRILHQKSSTGKSFSCMLITRMTKIFC